MNLENIKSRALASWATVGVLAVLCLVLAALQYMWIGEVSRAEKTRLQDGLQSALQRLAQDFNGEISATVTALRPTAAAIADTNREEAYSARWQRWRETAQNPALFRRLGLAVPGKDSMALLLIDEETGRYEPTAWPDDWVEFRDSLRRRVEGGRGGPPPESLSTVMEIPRFGRMEREDGPPVEQEWLVVEVDKEYIRSTYLPALLAKHIGTGMPIYARVSDRFQRAGVIFESGHLDGAGDDVEPEASVFLLDAGRIEGFGRGGGGGPQREFSREKGAPKAKRQPGGKGGPPAEFSRGRWQLDVRYAEGSLDKIVQRVRWRNLGISAAILALMLLTSVLLVRFSRQQQELAELQMNFVAGVSHELRTPLTVIRTAAYNLRGRVAANPAQVERYGALIQDESEKLTALVEQVLRFSSARAGHAVGERSPVAIEGVIEESLHSRRLDGAGSKIVVERDLEEGLPLVMADELALKHAIQNLLDNAVKYGTENSDWIGVSAKKVAGAKGGDAVEVRISDRGPGIPREEQPNIFNPFFRGRRAQQDQIHGTGLGLNLVKKIVEAHEGEIRLESEPGHGTAFIMKIPAAPAELQDEFAHTAG